MKTGFFVLVVCCFAALSGAYELREWMDVDGNVYQGRFVRELFGKLTVEDDEGNESTIAIADLSDLDKKYIRVMIPPKLDVVVRTQTKALPRRPMALWRDDDEDEYWLVAEISKESQRPFTSRLNIEAFLVADEYPADNYILLAHFTDDFLLVGDDDYVSTYKSPKVQTTVFTETGTSKRKGEVYKGYIFIITSQQGDVISMKSDLPQWMQEPAMLEKLRELSIRGAASVRSRHFNKAGEKVSPPRPTNYSVTVH